MARFGRIRAIRSYAYGPFLYLVSYLITSYIYGFLFILTMIRCFMESIKDMRMMNGCRIPKDRLFIYHKLSRVILLMPPEGLHTQLLLKIFITPYTAHRSGIHTYFAFYTHHYHPLPNE